MAEKCKMESGEEPKDEMKHSKKFLQTAMHDKERASKKKGGKKRGGMKR